MKKPNFPEHQENFAGEPRDQTDMALVNFIKQNKPITPPPAPNFEQRLFTEISKYPQKSNNRSIKRWFPWAVAVVIPVVIAAGIGFNLANNRSQLQIASNSVSESERAAIEQSLINSWDATDVTLSTTSSTDTQTQLLMELSPLEYE
ncbi:MAG: hypothetical protein ACK5EU_05405 [Pseudanabaena sp.]|jgi:hypothetical protein|uniref:hypothetical protein n=1 Tax=Pseudanabaena mucicola TaxID=71190 RepID=UPI002575B6C9|nr:hypothetical protein [Pseudanabaena mucicola]MCA6553473.1 hypothetical protein [Pseudanabaena sp. M135S2SP2A07QC]MCA6573962.1 hypothetical protein [Pseudanabaena sp. M53BS1SP1A06MG]MCA6584767.1 hypothetical protein [Pseudanabaena sp. M34BS1SP1A06MG]MCA6585929.1 hypothetical protein [Pseudanabaena sp. M051S1SP1A06QC]MCA6588200.1 hypothetical protein [Pseudanabaena sp. M109S1SP1A06QC]MCA6594245.1 hypothetical protein [Pseudanabaena sp. M38BS1SP1A06MG]MCA6598622.1 hypothetical protein [Pseud